MNSASEYLTQSENWTVVIAKYYCPFRWCNRGPFTPASLYEHLTGHKRPALARMLVLILTKQEEAKNAKR